MILQTSGTTGTPKQIVQSDAKLKAANAVARQSQNITADSKVYTVCKITHAGGALAQTLPAQEIGAKVDIVDFNAYDFAKNVTNYTHTHITPKHAKAIMGTKGFWDLDMSNVWVTCGSDPVTWDIIEAFVERGATFMTKWGMTEVGPCAINTVFDNVDKVNEYKAHCHPAGTLMGDKVWCDYKIVNDELYIRGDICVYDGWFKTGDWVDIIDGKFYYFGRK